MSRCSIWLGAVLFAGCGFEAAPGENDLIDQPDSDQPDSDPLDEPLLERKCDPSDQYLRLCLDFEDSVTDSTDGSGRGHHPELVEGLTTNVRDGELAVEMGMSSKLQIPEHRDLDIESNLTVSMWVSTARPAAGSSYWLLDNNTQYSMSIQPNGAVRCGLGASVIDSVTGVNIGGTGWHHVACTYDGAWLKIYVDGWVAGCRNLNRPIATTGAEGTSIGSNIGAGPVFADRFIGGLDNVQVFARTWSGSELCAASGNSLCKASCDGVTSGSGGG